MKIILALSTTVLLILSAMAFLRQAPPAAIVDSPESILAISESIHPSLAGLIDENGQTLPPTYLNGRWSLVFFGYSRCPDVCPVTLGFLGRLAETLPNDALKIHFVSLDPNDSAATLKDYTDHFHKAILGVTGDAANQQKATDSFQAAFRTDQGLMTHPTQLFVVDPQGRLRYVVKNINAPQELIGFFSRLEGQNHASP